MDDKIFSVSLFFRRVVDNGNARTTQERLVADFVKANNKFEAFGIFYAHSKPKFQAFDLVYDLTIEQNEEISKQLKLSPVESA